MARGLTQTPTPAFRPNSQTDDSENAEQKGNNLHSRCSDLKFERERLRSEAVKIGGTISDWPWAYGTGIPTRVIISSGRPEGVDLAHNLYDFLTLPRSSDHDSELVITGQDSRLFVVTSNGGGDEYPLEAHDYRISSLRPLPHGNFTLTVHYQEGIFVPCDYRDEALDISLVVEVVPPKNTLIEALFDPVEAADASDKQNLNVQTFEARLELVRHRMTDPLFEIEAESDAPHLSWGDGTVDLMFGAETGSASFEVQIIELDGTVSSRFRSQAAVKSEYSDGVLYTWHDEPKPWDAGDKLMVRIIESSSDQVSTTESGSKPGSCELDLGSITLASEPSRVVVAYDDLSDMCSSKRGSGHSHYFKFSLLESADIKYECGGDNPSDHIAIKKLGTGIIHISEFLESDRFFRLDFGSYEVDIHSPDDKFCRPYYLEFENRKTKILSYGR